MINGLGPRLRSVLKGLGVFIGGAALAASIYVGAVALFLYHECDEFDETPHVANSRGDVVWGHLRACKVLIETDDSFVVMRMKNQWSFFPEKTLIGYEPRYDGKLVLRWIDDKTLSVDLGNVFWVSSSRIDKVKDIDIVYRYTLFPTVQGQ
ncbi:hypothetical protein [Methylocapsa palsarum]|uniref:Uncharacterized protein n=1 Tax=Methylocapsa palsarum TaxID=1612308 RepID=A0A1I3YKC4_9HYPH|nr:hypothetical protein [Methylocapsa palsarum]SFK32233.1 hypothetical protein SAMN05444581_10612 [Methylocapsa palsarum]